jgi:hypothetical protein
MQYILSISSRNLTYLGSFLSSCLRVHMHNPLKWVRICCVCVFWRSSPMRVHMLYDSICSKDPLTWGRIRCACSTDPLPWGGTRVSTLSGKRLRIRSLQLTWLWLQEPHQDNVQGSGPNASIQLSSTQYLVHFLKHITLVALSNWKNQSRAKESWMPDTKSESRPRFSAAWRF